MAASQASIKAAKKQSPEALFHISEFFLTKNAFMLDIGMLLC